MNLLNAIDNPLLVCLYSGLAMFSVARMNLMHHRNTPKMEVAAWWFIGVGAFAVAWFDVNGVFTEWGHVLFGVGVALLIGMHVQPEWASPDTHWSPVYSAIAVPSAQHRA